MKPEEALFWIKDTKYIYENMNPDMELSRLKCEAFDVAIQALEKQVPNKVKNIRFSRDRKLAEHNIKEGECPECGETMTGNTFGYYCGCCGVALDWGNEE